MAIFNSYLARIEPCLFPPKRWKLWGLCPRLGSRVVVSSFQGGVLSGVPEMGDIARFCFVFPRSPSTALLSPFLGEGSPTNIDYRKKGTLSLTSLLEDLVFLFGGDSFDQDTLLCFGFGGLTSSKGSHLNFEVSARGP